MDLLCLKIDWCLQLQVSRSQNWVPEQLAPTQTHTHKTLLYLDEVGSVESIYERRISVFCKYWLNLKGYKSLVVDHQFEEYNAFTSIHFTQRTKSCNVNIDHSFVWFLWNKKGPSVLNVQ